MLLPNWILRKLIFLLILASLAEAVSKLEEAKEALKKDRGLVLVPVQRTKRNTDTCYNQTICWASKNQHQDDQHHSKYKRLSHSVHVQTDIRYRYATTLVTSEVYNPEQRAREIYLTVILPDTAFISRFAIEIGGQLFVAYVKEKEEAWKTYQDAVSQGKTAGHVGVSARHSNQFRVSVNTEARSRVTFYLLYEELLQRKRGIYEHVINLTPRQKLKAFGIDIQIKENRPLKDLSVPGLKRQGILLQNSTEMLDEAHILKDPSYPGSARISYRPKLEVLQKMLQSKHALQFSARYDVDRNEDKEGSGAGEIQVLDGYFAHFVAPENLPPMAKHVQFVLDTSGSMEGKKLQQLKEAMKSILDELRSQDFFSILQFSDEIFEWRSSMAAASKENVAEAKVHIEALQAFGGTNMHGGLRRALSRLQEQQHLQESKESSSAMIIFLTDGHATSGITQKDQILMDIQAANSNLTGMPGVPIFCLSFGRFADFDLLKVLALQNHGFSRKIYIAADAALQLQGFYQEVSSPLLQNVDFTYQNSEILSNSLTSTNFHTYYQGSEMVVAGRVVKTSSLDHHRDDLIEYQILATQASGQDYLVKGQKAKSSQQQQAEFYPQTITETVFDVLPRVRQSVNGVNFLERLWAYLTIKNLLERVAKGDLNSCSNKFESKIEKRSLPMPSSTIDDEDYDEEEGSGGSEYDYVEDILDEVGDDDNIVICDNIEYALYLSLKYEFVTPLTSLVVVGPDDDQQEGDLSEAEGHTRRHTPNLIRFSSRSNHNFNLDVILLQLLLLSSTLAFS